MNNNNAIELLDKRITKLKQEGVINIYLYPLNKPYTKNEIAQSILDLMDAPIVNDPDIF